MVLREEHDVLPSTQTRAIELAREGAPDGSVVVARTQSAGRGRFSHDWASPPGGLYLSLLLPGVESPSPVLTLAVGVALLDRLNARYDAGLQLRWPNDLVFLRPGRPPAKVAGILVDVVAAGERGSRTVVGFGVNVETSEEAFPSGLQGRATSLVHICRGRPSIPEVEAEAVGSALEARSDLLDPERSGRWVRAVQRSLFGVGLVGVDDGGQSGRISGVSEDGSLELQGLSGPIRVQSGEVRIEGA